MPKDLPTSAETAQAARWFAAQRRRLGSLEELDSYRHWSESAANRSALARLHALWADLGHAYAADEHSSIAPPSRKVAIAIGCIAAATLGLMCCVEGPFWTSLDWITR
jgi:ferric-dicitrate binding protein FerR (iron transport regulator)